MPEPVTQSAEGKGATPAAAPKAEAPAPLVTAAPTAMGPELDITVQSGIRWSPATENIIRAAKARTGKTRRALVEEAIAQVWGS